MIILFQVVSSVIVVVVVVGVLGYVIDRSVSRRERGQ
jgi:hypothetical protein